MQPNGKEHCWNNRPAPQSHYYGIERVYFPDGSWALRQIRIENRMTKDCQQPGGRPPLPGCVGCEHLKGAPRQTCQTCGEPCEEYGTVPENQCIAWIPKEE